MDRERETCFQMIPILYSFPLFLRESLFYRCSIEPFRFPSFFSIRCLYSIHLFHPPTCVNTYTILLWTNSWNQPPNHSFHPPCSECPESSSFSKAEALISFSPYFSLSPYSLYRHLHPDHCRTAFFLSLSLPSPHLLFFFITLSILIHSPSLSLPLLFIACVQFLPLSLSTFFSSSFILF